MTGPAGPPGAVDGPTGPAGALDGVADELLRGGRVRDALVTDPGAWCRERELGRVEVEALVAEIRERAAHLDPADRRVALASCFALGSAVRG